MNVLTFLQEWWHSTSLQSSHMATMVKRRHQSHRIQETWIWGDSISIKRVIISPNVLLFSFTSVTLHCPRMSDGFWIAKILAQFISPVHLANHTITWAHFHQVFNVQVSGRLQFQSSILRETLNRVILTLLYVLYIAWDYVVLYICRDSIES